MSRALRPFLNVKYFVSSAVIPSYVSLLPPVPPHVTLVMLIPMLFLLVIYRLGLIQPPIVVVYRRRLPGRKTEYQSEPQRSLPGVKSCTINNLWPGSKQHVCFGAIHSCINISHAVPMLVSKDMDLSTQAHIKTQLLASFKVPQHFFVFIIIYFPLFLPDMKEENSARMHKCFLVERSYFFGLPKVVIVWSLGNAS